MFSLELDPRQEDRDLLIAELWEAGCCGILETGRGLRAFFEDDRQAAGLRESFASRMVSFQIEEPRDWVAVSRSGWEPVLVGARFFLAPEWLDRPAPPGRLRIAINPGLACGSGTHEATQLCLEAAERFLKPGTTVLDVGTGSGILSQAAALLGAERVVACDVDPVAVRVARGRFEAETFPVLLFQGSAGALRSGSADLIVANISAPAAVDLSGEILRCLRAGGTALLSGFEEHERPAVETAFRSHGGILLGSWKKARWTLVAGAKTRI